MRNALKDFKPSRRTLLIGGGFVAIGLGYMTIKKSDNSGARDPYFLAMQDALMRAGIAKPTLVIDLARLNSNIETLNSHLPKGMGYRIVAKSLPSLDLLNHIRVGTGTKRLMTFNQPMLNTVSKSMPEVDQLLGKPLPVAGAKTYFKNLKTQHANSADQIQWLIDTSKRLEQYSSLATSVGRKIRVNLELDVGLHRGGFEPNSDLAEALKTIDSNPTLKFSGFMGYEPHLPALPTAFGWRERAKQGAWEKYRQCKDMAHKVFGDKYMSNVTLNTAGSPTYRFYKDTSLANEVSAGSCLVKPTDFDSELLEPHLPASFIATPVIKSFDQTRMPGIEFADGLNRTINPNSTKTIFIYGGKWMASPVDPPGLETNKTFGRSSNQEMLNGGQNLQISPDEFVFLRPHQSEAVFLQFGAIAIYKDGVIVDEWSVFETSA